MVYKRISQPPTKYWKTQLPVDYITTGVADPIVINTWYTATANLSGGKPAKLLYILVEQTNNGATAETIELEITINGTAYVFTAACDDGSEYYGRIRHYLVGGDFDTVLSITQSLTNALSNAHSVAFIAEKVGLIRVRQTTAVDAVAAQIEVNIVWEKLVEY